MLPRNIGTVNVIIKLCVGLRDTPRQAVGYDTLRSDIFPHRHHPEKKCSTGNNGRAMLHRCFRKRRVTRCYLDLQVLFRWSGQPLALKKHAAPGEVWNRRVSFLEFGASLEEDKLSPGNRGTRSIQARGRYTFYP